MARFVLLHSPQLGPSSWRAVAIELRTAGHAAETPAWPRLSTLDGELYDTMADRLVGELAGGGEPPVLVAHSGAGAFVPAVADRLGSPAAGAIFVDAILPHPGRSWFDTAPDHLRRSLRSGVQDGLLPAWHEWWPPGALEHLVPDGDLRMRLIDELEPIPAAYFEATAPAGEAPGRSAYLKLSDAYEDEARLANRQGWPLVRLPLDHLALFTKPAAVARAVTGLAERLAAS